MKMSRIDNDFCPFCGLLKQISTMVKCKSCINNDTELKNPTKLQKCTCEYCMGIGFHVPQDPVDLWIDISKNNDVSSKWHSGKICSKPDMEKDLRIGQECCDLLFEWEPLSLTSLPDWTEYSCMEDWGSPIPNEAHGTEVMEPSEETQQIWMREQNKLKQQLVLEDNIEITKLKRALKKKNYSNRLFYFGGMDISFVKGDDVKACAALVVVRFPDLKVVYEDYEMVELTEPYIPGFLAFREAGFLIDLYNKLVSFHPQFTPDVIFLDGNGILHPREFGLASHVGVLLHTPCVGVAKNLIHIDGVDNDGLKSLKTTLKKGGDTMPIKDSSGKTLGMALRSLDSTTNPIYISCGHLVCLDTAVLLVKACCKYRIPEPVRQADLNSREFLRKAGFM